jgi:hypothetical protein
MSDLERNTDRTTFAEPSCNTSVAGTFGVDPTGGSTVSTSSVCGSTVAAALAILFAAWCAAGSLGLVAHPLRLALVYAALTLAASATWPWNLAGRRSWWLIGILGLVALRATTAVSAEHELAVVLAVAAWLAMVSHDNRRLVLQACTRAVAVLALFRVACSSVWSVWLLGDFIGQRLGRGVGSLLGVPLNVGASFAGLDFLVLMAALFAGWLIATEGSKVGRAVATALAVLGVHLLYLITVAYALDWVALLPAAAEPVFDHPYVPPAWSWSNEVRQLLPWNLPALAAILHLAVVAIMFRWSRWPAAETAAETDTAASGTRAWAGRFAWRQGMVAATPYIAAAMLPICATLSLTRTDLSGKRFVANQEGNLDWERPQHERYGHAAAGWFGMLPPLVESLGGALRVSPDLGAADLAQADVVLLLHPNGPVAEPTRQRLREFVRRGGSLLVVAEPYQQQGDVRSGFDDVLAETRIRVRHDVAVSAAGGWQHSSEWLAHPVTRGIGPRTGAYFSDLGPSLEVRWPARPLVLGRWGWSDPGSDAVLTGVSRLEAGERLGDLVLAAEEHVGAGRVLVLADAFPLTNEGGVRAYGYTGRLLSYLAQRPTGPQTPWRQAATMFLGLGLLAAVAYRLEPSRVLAVVLIWTASQTACEAFSRHASRVVPDGRLVALDVAASDGSGSGSRLAYIDASHLPAYSDAQWAFDGINGLTLALMRSGYLTLTLPELSRERLERAAIFVTVAPARPFTAAQRRQLVEFVERGGTFFCLVGAEESASSASLLDEFGIRVPPSPVPTTGRWHEPEPLGHVRAMYGDGDPEGPAEARAEVQFYAAWPVATDANAEVLVRTAHGQPVVVSRQIGSGRIVVIGDTGFALNKNLEYVGGQPFRGRYDNAHFWRWLLGRVTDAPPWSPPVVIPQDEEAAVQEVQP